MSNCFGLHIDAQFTMEVFGALAPAMPHQALIMGDLPIRTTSNGHSTHAASYYAAMHSLVPLVPDDLALSPQGPMARR